LARYVDYNEMVHTHKAGDPSLANQIVAPIISLVSLHNITDVTIFVSQRIVQII